MDQYYGPCAKDQSQYAKCTKDQSYACYEECDACTDDQSYVTVHVSTCTYAQSQVRLYVRCEGPVIWELNMYKELLSQVYRGYVQQYAVSVHQISGLYKHAQQQLNGIECIVHVTIFESVY